MKRMYLGICLMLCTSCSSQDEKVAYNLEDYSEKVVELRASSENYAREEVVDNLMDGKDSTKWLGLSRNAAIEIEYNAPIEIKGYKMKSANDEPNRDPGEWKLEGEGKQGWELIQKIEKGDPIFNHRYETRLFKLDRPVKYKKFRFMMTNQESAGTNMPKGDFRPTYKFPRLFHSNEPYNNYAEFEEDYIVDDGSYLQLAELKLLSWKNIEDAFDPQIEIYEPSHTNKWFKSKISPLLSSLSRDIPELYRQRLRTKSASERGIAALENYRLVFVPEDVEIFNQETSSFFFISFKPFKEKGLKGQNLREEILKQIKGHFK